MSISEGTKIFLMSVGPGNMPLIILGICGAAGYSRDAGVTKDPAMPNYFQNTPFPVRDPDPNLWKTIFSMSASDATLWGAFGTSGFAYGNWTALKSPMAIRVPTVAMAGSLGVTAGLFVAFQRSSGRLLGLTDPDGW